MAQQGKVLATKPNTLSSILGTYMVQGEKQFSQVVWFPQAHHGIHTQVLCLSLSPHPCLSLTHTINICNEYFKNRPKSLVLGLQKGSWPTGWESLFYSKTERICSLFSVTVRDSPAYRHVPLTQVFSSIVRIHQGERLSLLQGVLLPRVQNCLAYWYNLCWSQYLDKEKSKSQSQSRTSLSGPSNIKSEGFKRWSCM